MIKNIFPVNITKVVFHFIHHWDNRSTMTFPQVVQFNLRLSNLIWTMALRGLMPYVSTQKLWFFFVLCLCPPPLDWILISRSESQHRGPGSILNAQIQLWRPKFSLECPNPALLHKSKHMKVLGCPFRDLKIWIWKWLKKTFLIYIMQSTTSQEPSLFWFQSLFCVWYTGYVSTLDTWILTLTGKLI